MTIRKIQITMIKLWVQFRLAKGCTKTSFKGDQCIQTQRENKPLIQGYVSKVANFFVAWGFKLLVALFLLIEKFKDD